MIGKRTPRPLVIERYGRELNEKQVTQALGGQHSTPAMRAVEQIIEDFIATARQSSEDRLTADSARAYDCGGAGWLGDLLGEIRSKTGAEK